MLKYLRRFICAIILSAAVALSSCGNDIADFPKEKETVPGSYDSADSGLKLAENSVRYAGELFGSYLTMYTGHITAEERGLPFVRVFTSFSDIETYYNTTQATHIYARQFTLDMASFNDEFFKENDVLALVINEPSGYINHTAEPVEIYADKMIFKITRHQPEASPLLDTEYHLLFTAPKGSFDGIEALPIELEISEVVDSENYSANDAEYFRRYSPEFTSFVYRADSFDGSTETVVDAIDGYEELVSFYDQYKDTYDLDSEFKSYIGTLYSWDICDRYILLAVIVPCEGSEEPEVSDIFVNDLQIYTSVSANEGGSKPDSWYLILCAIERRDLIGVDLDVVYLSVE